MKKFQILKGAVAIILIGMVLNGCATLNGTTPFKYVPSMVSNESLPFRLSVEKLVEDRPSSDRSATTSITDIDEKVTSKLIEDLRASQIFSAVDFSSGKGDLVLKGKIKRFYWKAKPTVISLIPLVNLALLFGLPEYLMEGVAELHVVIQDGRSGHTLADYDKRSQHIVPITWYDVKAGEVGAELAEAFRDVMKLIKEAIVSDARKGRFKHI